MADTTIAAKLTVDTGTSAQDVKAVNKAVSDVNTTLKDTSATAKTVSKDIGESTGNFKNLKDQMSALPGPLGAAGESVNKLGSAFKALLLNPVVATIAAIVAGLAFLYKAFTNTFEGGEKVEQVFAGIKAAIQEVIDRVLAIGGALIKFFSGDFKGALADAKAAVTGIGDAIEDAYNKVSQLTKQAQALHKEQLQNDLDQADRAKKLAQLREQATDESIPVAKRKESLIELQKLAEEDAKKDVDLAKRTAENKIALLSIGTDAAKKNQDEINKIRVDQINVETQSANELRRIGKQITAADKQEQAERKAAETDAANHAKEERQKLLAFTTQLYKLQGENDLLVIKDAYAKEQLVLEQKIADEKKTIKQALADGKLTRAQAAQLNAAEDVKANLERDALTDKHNKEVADKEEKFQTELNAIKQKTELDGITDARASERIQLEITHQEKINAAIKEYKDDADKLFQIKTALDQQFRAQQAKIDEKNKKEDDKKAFDIKEQAEKIIIQDRDKSYDERIAAIDADQALVQQAFDNKVLTELEYNKKVEELANARVSIRDQERQHNEMITSAIADAFMTLSDIAGKQTVAGKALAIAGTTIKTFQSAVSAFAGMTETIPGPVGIALGIVAAAGAIATGLAAVKKIVAVQIPGQASGGSVPTAPTLPTAPAAPVAPTRTGTTLDQSSINNLGSAVSARAYVVDADVNNAQDRDARLRRAAMLGGGR